jgi:CMP-N-acetylneuraminate monooxygenase
MLLTSFAGGASGYPVCWEDYSQQRRKEILQKKRQAVLLNVVNMVTKTRPRFYVPFACYFTEAHPADHAMKILNTKNTPEQVRELLRQHCPDTATWIPQPGATFDGEQVHAVSVSPRSCPGNEP